MVTWPAWESLSFPRGLQPLTCLDPGTTSPRVQRAFTWQPRACSLNSKVQSLRKWAFLPWAPMSKVERRCRVGLEGSTLLSMKVQRRNSVSPSPTQETVLSKHGDVEAFHTNSTATLLPSPLPHCGTSRSSCHPQTTGMELQLYVFWGVAIALVFVTIDISTAKVSQASAKPVSRTTCLALLALMPQVGP